jgi:hypothetical protein
VQLRDIPQTRIACTGTLPHRDPALLERARAAGRLWVTDAGHDLMITEPNAVAELLLRVPAAPQTYQSGSPPGPAAPGPLAFEAHDFLHLFLWVQVSIIAVWPEDTPRSRPWTAGCSAPAPP